VLGATLSGALGRHAVRRRQDFSPQDELLAARGRKLRGDSMHGHADLHWLLAFPLLSLVCTLFSVLLGCLATVFWLWMLIDCLSYEPSQGNDKILWVLVIVLTHGLGAVLYYFIRRPERIKQFGK
jgi:hypothetical protein